MLLSLWIGAFGDDPVVLRLPSLISQSLAILMIYAVTARLAGGEVGILASVLLAFSPHAIELGRMLRSYSPLILLSLILLWLTLDLVSTRRRGGGGSTAVRSRCCPR